MDLAAALDRRLAGGEGDGWRYATMPDDGEAYRLGVQGLDQAALLTFGADFATLEPSRQDAVLLAVQREAAPGEAWDTVPPARFFEDLLAELCECYYSDP